MRETLEEMRMPVYVMPMDSSSAFDYVLQKILPDVPENKVRAALSIYRNGLLNELIEVLECSTSIESKGNVTTVKLSSSLMLNQ